jgi:hypothetical protein
MARTPAMPDPQTVISGLKGAGHGAAVHVKTTANVADLAGWLLSPFRDRVVVIVTVPFDRGRAFIDADAVAADYPDRVEVYLIVTGPLTYQLTDLLPDETGVYGGATRIFPVGLAWTSAPWVAELFMCRGDDEAERTTTRLRQSLQRALSNRASPGGRTQPATTALAYSPDGMVRDVGSGIEAHHLAEYLLDPKRSLVIVVVSVHPQADRPYLDADTLAVELRGVAVVAVVQADATYGLTDGLGDKTLSVFYGAGRVYPVGTGWVQDMYEAPLHMCPHPQAAKYVAANIVSDALTAAHQAGSLTAVTDLANDRATVAEVTGFLGDNHVLLRSDTGEQCVMLAAHLFLDTPVERLVVQGQRLTGRIRSAATLAEFIPTPINDDPTGRAQLAYPNTSTALARVDQATADSVTVLLHPQVKGILSVGVDDEDVVGLLSPGDVAAVTVSWTDDGFIAHLVDVGDAQEPRAGLSLLPGGPPWLIPDDLEFHEPEPKPQPADAASAPAPAVTVTAAPSPSAVPVPNTVDLTAASTTETGRLERQLSTAQDAADMLAADLARAQADLTKRNREISHLRSELRKTRLTARTRKQRDGQTTPAFSDPAQQLRHDIWLAYLTRIPEGQRCDLPLPSTYTFGPGFITSLNTLEGITRDKVLAVLVEVLTGLAKDLDSRRLHPWVEGKAGQQEKRSDGAKAWRVSLQNDTPGARRLKYWQIAGGAIELDFVGHHDDGIT